MQKPYDVMARGLGEGVVAGPCVVRVEEAGVADARAIDLVIEPIPGRVGELASRGLLGRLAREACVLEAHHDPPTPDDVDECLLKVVALHARQRGAWRARPVATRGPAPPRPALWIVSAGVPDAAIAAWALEPIAGWPAGCLASRAVRAPRLVVVSRLPRTRATLMARLMGAGETLRRAFRDLHALPADAWERAVVAPLLKLLRHDLPRMGIGEYTPEEDAMRYQEALLLHREDLEKARAEVRAEVRAEGVARLLRLYARRLGRAVTDGERATVLARLDVLGPARLDDAVLDLDAAALAAWLADPRAT